MLKINNIDVTSPKVLTVDIIDIDGEATRNAKGDIIRDRLATKRKLNCEWPALTAADAQTLLTAVQGVFFTVRYPDPMLGYVTKTFYVGDRSIPALIVRNGVMTWEGLKMNFIER